MSLLTESIPSTNVKIIELYNKIDSGALKLSPEFQRKLVWKKQHKFHFIETILKNYPFPEVYIASSEMDVTAITSSEIVVDGQQRLSTIVDYVKGVGDFDNQNRVKSFAELSTNEKKQFLNYFVSVRDLKNIELDIIKDIFMRINNTEYSLNAVEKINAQYGDGEFIVFCKQIADSDYLATADETDCVVDKDIKDLANKFFSEGAIFTENDIKRMINLQYIMTLVATIVESEYFNRNDKVPYYIEKYNASFDRKDVVEARILNAINIFKLMNFETSSYWFSKSNSFTLFVELSNVVAGDYDIECLKEKLVSLDQQSKKYFAGIELETIPSENVKYFEYAKEAVNAKGARIYRGAHIQKMISACKAKH